MGHENGGWMNSDQRSATKADALFPIMGDRIGTRRGYIPMAIMRRHNAQAMKNHCGQTVEVLRSRGGLSPQEALAVVMGTSWKDRPCYTDAGAWLSLQQLVATEFPEFAGTTGEIGG